MFVAARRFAAIGSAAAAVGVAIPGCAANPYVAPGAIDWDCRSLVTDADGSDLWPVTWSDDDHQYTAWGDGNGFEGSERFGYGLSRLEGEPDRVTGVDLGEFSPGGGGGKISGLISLGGVLYMLRNDQNGPAPTRSLIRSTDKGLSIEPTPVVFDAPRLPSVFVQRGRDHGDATDGYVYATGGDWSAPSPTFLFRVAENELENPDAWAVFSGTSESPAWSTDFSRAAAIFAEPAAESINGGLKGVVTYMAGREAYLLTFPIADDMGRWTIQEGPNPWGPWTELATYADWCGWSAGEEETLHRYIAPKWISEDGLAFWMVFSGVNSSSGDWDRFNLIEGRFRAP